MRTMIVIPCMDTVNVDFFRSLLGCRMPKGEIRYSITASSLIYDARNQLAVEAIKTECDRMIWLDSDMVFEPDLFQKLEADMDEGRDLVSGLYFSRRGDNVPVIYKTCEVHKDEAGKMKHNVDVYLDYPKNQIFEIKGCGFGAVMCTTAIMREVIAKFGLPFSPILGLGEDLSFCARLNQLGIHMYCDSSIKVGHVGYTTITEKTYWEKVKMREAEAAKEAAKLAKKANKHRR